MRHVTLYSETWCAPCKAVATLLQKLHQDGKIVYDIVRAESDEGKQNHVFSVPTMLVRDEQGIEVDRIVGFGFAGDKLTKRLLGV